MSESTRRTRARQVIKDIVKGHGFVQESSLQTMTPDVRREVEEALLAKDLRIGSSVLTLARNLYSSQARFVFELLQNADDNRYTNGQDPYVFYRVYPDQVVIECNEDGFNEDNLKAICDIGRSSKTGSHGYIGEKGIGFKSVFMVAERVHIQSGDYSFKFIQRKGDSGMGMITPIWQDSTDSDLASEVTRITLYLHKEDNPAERDQARQIINQQFLELQDTLLLFLRNLQKISISFHDEEGKLTTSKIYAIRRVETSGTAVIERTCYPDAVEGPELMHYHIVKHTATGLARSENRDLSGTEDANRSSTTSEVVLAFPVTPLGIPVIEPQEVYAFLPVRRMGFNFLIHADFVTSANRQDLVVTSPRNLSLVNAIADAFIAGVRQLCEDTILQYQWMRYLPVENTNDPYIGLWKDFTPMIKSKLATLVVLRSLERGTRRRIKDLYIRPEAVNDQNGAPLFADLPEEVYISNYYTPADTAILKNFGLGVLSIDIIIKMVEQDLGGGLEHSRIMSPNTSDGWQTRAYTLLNLPWLSAWHSSILYLKGLDIVPLEGGAWVKSSIGDIFYPEYNNIMIPKDLGLRLVEKRAIRNRSRAAFLSNLGVRQIDVPMLSYIRQLVLGQPTSLESSVERIQFLFLTQHLFPEEGTLSNRFVVYDNLGLARYPSVDDMYISNDDRYGAKVFLQQQGRRAYCVNSKYYEGAPSIAPGSGLTLVQWMHQHLGIREHLRLVSSDQYTLSVECLDTAETRKSEFLGFLAHLWAFEGHFVLRNESLLYQLRQTSVLCMNGHHRVLSQSYLPLRSLLDLQSRFLGNEYFPFLEMSELHGENEVPPRWSFLVNDLGVGNQDSIDFRLQLMTCIKDTSMSTGSLSNPLRVIDLYHSIEALARLAVDRKGTSQLVSDVFRYDLVVIPEWNSLPTRWTNPARCLWDAPTSFVSAIPLKETYSALLRNSSIELQHMEPFFCGTLGVGKLQWGNVVNELKELKQRTLEIRSEVIGELYAILGSKSPVLESDKELMRNLFEENNLIYFDLNGTAGWYKPSQCVWSDTTHIHGMIALNSQYSALEHLFVVDLRVPQLDLRMIVDQLLAARTLQLPVLEVKELLKNLNSFLRTEPDPPSPARLLHARLFPIREPNSEVAILCTSNTQFTVIDRDGPPSRFKEMVQIFDFTLQEIRQLEPLLTWTGLESRYLSRSMKEISRIGDGETVPIQQAHRDLKMKAYELLRVAAAFNSPRYERDSTGLYDTLRNAVTLQSGMISSRLSFEQDGFIHNIEIGQSELHIEDANPLTVYVPKDAESQECCFMSDLPHRFASWMMIDPSTDAGCHSDHAIINILNPILNCSISACERILEKEGIPALPEIPEIPVSIAKSENTALGVTQERRMGSLLQTPSRSHGDERRSSPESVSSPPATPWSPGGAGPDHPTPLTDPEDYDSDEGVGTLNESHHRRPPQFQIPTQESQSQYRRLLEGVVSLARRANLPAVDDDFSYLLQGLSVEDDPFEGFQYFTPSHDWEHKKRLGAAGELFVFEILSGYNDRNNGLQFSLLNWCSRIRGEAALHPDYAGLTNWQGVETSDIVYDDIYGGLTQIMVSLGYLDTVYWAGKTPRYYIEVKSTTGPCAAPFFVSQNQVTLMEDSTNGPAGNQNQTVVYALFRVFNLGRSSMGLKIYIDPAEQRRIDKLSFTSEKYAVTPTGR